MFGTEVISIVEMSMLPKAIYRFKADPLKIPMAYFLEIGEIMLKLVWNNQKIAKTTFRRKDKAGGIALHDFRLYYKYRHIPM